MIQSLLFISGLLCLCDGQTLVENGDFDEELQPWKTSGCTAHLEDGIVHISNRKNEYSGVYQMLNTTLLSQMNTALRLGIRVKADEEMLITIKMKVVKAGKTSYLHLATLKIQVGTWQDLWSTYTIPESVADSESAKLYFEVENLADFWLDKVVFQPIEEGNWKNEANERIDQLRKRNVRIVLRGGAEDNLSVDVEQISHAFPFGTMVQGDQLNDCLVSGEESPYCRFTMENFNWIVDAYRMKWKYMEPEQGTLRTDPQDGMIQWAQRHGIKLRGHALLWEKQDRNPKWLFSKSPEDFTEAVYNRLKFATKWATPYALHWDVDNEMVDQPAGEHTFYLDHSQDPDFRIKIFKRVKELIPNTTLFLNDYGILDNRYNRFNMYLDQIRDLQERGAPFDAIGLQSHLGASRVDPEYFKYVVETLHRESGGVPIWITEFDWNQKGVVSDPDDSINAKQIEDFYRIMFSLPEIEGIVMWGFKKDNGSLVDDDIQPNEAGKAYLRLYHNEWRTMETGAPDKGKFSFRGFMGDYSLKIRSGDQVLVEDKFNLDEDMKIICKKRSETWSCQ